MKLMKLVIPKFSSVYQPIASISLEANEIAKSTEATLTPVWKFWREYCAKLDWVQVSNQGFGLCLYEKAFKCEDNEFLNRNPSVYCFDTVTIANFLSWLIDEKKASSHTARLCGTFFNAHLTAEYYCRMRAVCHATPNFPNVVIANLKEIGNVIKRAKRNKSAKQIKLNGNVLARVDDTISSVECRNMVDFILCRADLTTGARAHYMWNPMMLIQFLAQFTLQSQICRRGEDLYNQPFVHRFIKAIKTLGPKSSGTVASWLLINSSKVNKVGRTFWLSQQDSTD